VESPKLGLGFKLVEIMVKYTKKKLKKENKKMILFLTQIEKNRLKII
jgi:hypothetical protein